jgi:hypothetical protein
MSDACVITGMFQFRSWFFVSTRPHSQGYPDGGCRENASRDNDV